MNQKEFRVKLEGDKVILTIIETQQTVSSVELDKEDLIELTGDLNNYVGQLSNKGLTNEEQKKQAYEQAQRKLKLEAEMRRMFVDVLDTEYLETKFATVYKLDEINREVEILAKKLNKL